MKNRDIKLPKKYAFGLVGFYIFIFLGIIGIAFYIYTDLYTVYLIQKEITIDTGNQYQIELLPKNSKYFNYENYVYEIEDPSIVKVNKLGELTALKEGNTKVNVRFKNSFEKETLDVNVKNIEVTTLEVEKEFSLEKNSSKRLSIKVNNKDNISTNLVFLSEDTSIATVDNYGNVTGKNEGTTIITIKSSNGIEKKIKVEVTFSEEKIQEIRMNNKDYGYRRILGELRNQGYTINKKKVQRIVQKLGCREEDNKCYFLVNKKKVPILLSLQTANVQYQAKRHPPLDAR